MLARWKPPSPAGTIRTLGEFQTWFPTDADCLEYLEWLRWPAGRHLSEATRQGCRADAPAARGFSPVLQWSFGGQRASVAAG